MSRIEATFKQLQTAHKSALIPFFTAGDPDPSITVNLMHAMVKAGANILELGVPFSDPMADGPAIQKANERSLAANTSLRDVLKMVTQFRRQDSETPVILMGYLNPIEIMGYETFAKAASTADIDGVITVDLPPEEAQILLQCLAPYPIDPIFLIAPTTSHQRIEKICTFARGFIYYVAVKGVTGSTKLDCLEVATKVAQIKKITTLPVAVGFGIKDPKTAATIAKIADAAVVGSALVNFADNNETHDKITQNISLLLQQMRQAMDQNNA